MRYQLCFALCAFVFVPQARAQELSFSVAASGKVFPEFQLATQVASLMPAKHPTMLGVYVSYWNSSDNLRCVDCSLLNRDYLRSGIRLSQAVSNLPFRFSFGAGLRHQIQFVEVVEVGAYDSPGNYSQKNLWPEVFVRTDIRIVQQVLLETTIIRGSNFNDNSPVKEYFDIRLGFVYSI